MRFCLTLHLPREPVEGTQDRALSTPTPRGSAHLQEVPQWNIRAGEQPDSNMCPLPPAPLDAGTMTISGEDGGPLCPGPVSKCQHAEGRVDGEQGGF